MTVANFEKFKSSECLHQRPGTEKRCSHNLGRSTHNVASEVLNKTKKILIVFLPRLVSLHFVRSNLLNGHSFHFQIGQCTVAAISPRTWPLRAS